MFKSKFKKSLILLLPALLILPLDSRGDEKYDAIKKLLELKQYKLAHTRLEDIAKNDRISEEVLLEMAEMFHDGAQIPYALDLLESQKKYHSSSVKIRRKLANLYVESDQSRKAIGEYEFLVENEAQNRDYWIHLGKLYSWNEKPSKAIKAYETAVKMDPSDTESINQLSQLYLWNGHQEGAYALQKVLLNRNSRDSKLWKEHGMQARWMGKNKEAIAAFKNAISRDPDDAEAFLLLGETLFWENRQEEAQISLRYALKLNPSERKAEFYLAQMNQWRPFGWRDAKKTYEKILDEDPFNDNSKKYLHMLRQEYGPQLQGNAKYVDDSNGLERTDLTFLHKRYVNSRGELSVQSIFHRLEEFKSGRRVLSQGEGFQVGGLLHVSPKIRIGAGAGFVLFNQDEEYGLFDGRLEMSLLERNHWPGNLYTVTSVKRDIVLDGVMAIKQKLYAKRVRQNIYWQPFSQMILSGDAEKAWFSDDNQKLDVYVEGALRIFGGQPQLYLNGVYAYLDMTRIYPDADPYWTPKGFWTRSGGFTTQVNWGKNAWIRAGYALTQQIGNEYAHNWKAGFSWKLTPFARISFSYHDYGSKFYSSNIAQGEFSYRW